MDRSEVTPVNRAKGRSAGGSVVALMLLLGIFVLAPGRTSAQKPLAHDLLIQFAGLDGGKEKVIRYVLHELDPDMVLSLAVEQQLAKVRTTRTIDRDELEADLAPYDIHVVHMNGPIGPGPQERSTNTSNGNDPSTTVDPMAQGGSEATTGQQPGNAQQSKVVRHSVQPDALIQREAIKDQAIPADEVH